MKLWLLRPVGDLPADDNPWEPEYDKAHGFVVRAATEAKARAIARRAAGDENLSMGTPGRKVTVDPWKNARYSTCIELTPEGKSGIVIMDFYHG